MKNKITQSIIASSLLAVAAYAAPAQPSINITSTALGGSIYGDQNITFGIVDVNNSLTYYHSCDKNGSTTPYPGGNTNTNYTCTPTSSGDWYINVQAVDPEGVPSLPLNSKISVDIDDPVPSIGKVLNTNGTVTATLSASDLSRSSVDLYYTTDNTTPTTSSTSYTTELNFAVSATLKVLAVDVAGNEATTQDTISISTAQPTVQTTQYPETADGATFATNGDAGASAFNTSLSVSGDGFTRYKYKLSTASSYTEVTDITNTIDISSLSSGSYTYYIIGGDAYNYKDESDKKTVTFTVDNAAPTSLTVKYNNDSTVTTVNPANDNNPDTIVTLSATGSSSLGYKIQSDCTTLSAFSQYTAYNAGFSLGDGLTDGQQVKVCMAAEDTSGNWDSTSKTYIIDKVAPTITIPSAQSFAAEVTEYLSSSDETDTIKYLLSTGTCSIGAKTYNDLSSTYSDSVTISGTSDQCLYAASSDIAGNDSNVSATQFTYSASQATLNVDLVDNSVFATVATYNATPITDINVTGTNINLYTYEFDANGTVYNVSYNDSSDNLINLEGLQVDADHNITIMAFSDNNDSNATKFRTFTIDNTAPLAYDANDYNDSNLSVSSTVLELDNVDGDTVYYKINSGSYAVAPVSDTNTSKVKISINGTSTVYTYKEDEAGNQSSVYSATITMASQTYSLNAGWNLTTLPTDTFTNSGLSSAYVWDYNGTDWRNNISADSYIDITSGDSSKGYWVYVSSIKEITITGSDTSDNTQISSASTGWNLLGTTTDITDTSDANLTWAYNNGIWSYSTNVSDLNTTLDTLGYQSLDTIPAFSGYWIYKY